MRRVKRSSPAVPFLLALLVPGESRGASVSCDSGPSGLSSLVIEGEGAPLRVRETDGGLVIEIDDPGDALSAGSLRCPPARGVQVIPGSVLGSGSSRIVVTLGDRRPRVVQAEDRVRLLWLPPGVGEPETAVTRPAPERAREAERTREPQAPRVAERPAREDARRAEVPRTEEPAPAPRPEPSRAAQPAREREAQAPPPERVAPPEPPAPAARAQDRDLPADFLALERPVVLLASVETELRQGPGRRFPKQRALAPGTEIEIDGRAGDWVRTTSGAWGFGPYFEAPEAALQSGAFLARVEAIQARVHAGPAAHHEIVAEIYRGEQVVIDEVRAEWAHVRDGGWVRMSDISRTAAGEPR